MCIYICIYVYIYIYIRECMHACVDKHNKVNDFALSYISHGSCDLVGSAPRSPLFPVF